jgi:hypothetical protein
MSGSEAATTLIYRRPLFFRADFQDGKTETARVKYEL